MKKSKIICPLAFALDEVGDKWTFLILRNAFYGERHFNGFVKSLGIARNILTSRLEKMIQKGLLVPVETNDKREIEYQLTKKAKDLAGPLIALRLWAKKWNSELKFGGLEFDVNSNERIDHLFFKTKNGNIVEAKNVRVDLQGFNLISK